MMHIVAVMAFTMAAFVILGATLLRVIHDLLIRGPFDQPGA